jgi:hypothetical protein
MWLLAKLSIAPQALSNGDIDGIFRAAKVLGEERPPVIEPSWRPCIVRLSKSGFCMVALTRMCGVDRHSQDCRVRFIAGVYSETPQKLDGHCYCHLNLFFRSMGVDVG